MWILNFIPDAWLYKAIIMMLGAGAVAFAASFLLSFIPGFKFWGGVVKYISLLVLIIGAYGLGSYGTEMKWREEAAKLKADMDRKVAESEKHSKQIVTKYVTRTKVVKEKGDVIIKKVTEYVNKDADANCVIPKSFVLLHDSAAKNEVPDASKGIDGTPSSVKLSTVGETVTINYNNYHQLSERLKALQDWVTQQEKIYNGK